MKRIAFTFIFTFTLFAAVVSAQAQTQKQPKPAPAATKPAAEKPADLELSSVVGIDSVLVSQVVDGNQIVSKYLIWYSEALDYPINYRINSANLSSALSNNSESLKDFDAFMADILKDSSAKIQSIIITGFSSPDGSEAKNDALAMSRAQDFRNYVDKKYNLSKRYPVSVYSVADDWQMIRAQIEQSSVPNKKDVLAIIDSAQTDVAKEEALKKVPGGAWDYLAANVLPQVRRVDMFINYNDAGAVVEYRMKKMCNGTSCTCGFCSQEEVEEVIVIPTDTNAERKIEKKAEKKEEKIDKKAGKKTDDGKKTYKELENM